MSNKFKVRSNKEKFTYRELKLGMGVFAPIMAVVILVPLNIYDTYFKPDPIGEGYCYCRYGNDLFSAKLDYYEFDAKRTLRLIEDGKDLGQWDRVKIGDEILILKYGEDSSFVKIEWNRKSFNPRAGIISDSGWVPNFCVHEQPLNMDNEPKPIQSR